MRSDIFRLTLSVGFLTLLGIGTMYGQSARQRQRSLERRLAQPVTVAWQDQQLGVAIDRLGELYGLPTWLDRRIDPNQLVSLSQSKQPLATVFDSLAVDRPLSVAVLSDLIYLGPGDAADELETVLALRRAELTEASSEVRRAWLTPVPFRWPRLSEPRDILQEAVAAGGAKLAADQAVPYDLWDERRVTIGPLDLATIVLFGFDQTPNLDPTGNQFDIVEIKRPVQIVRTYPVDNFDESRIAQLRQRFSEEVLTLTNEAAQLAGTLAQHRQIARLLGAAGETTAPRPTPRKKRSTGRRVQQVYTLQIENQPVGPVVTHLASQLGLTVVWQLNSAADAIRATRVSCDVRQASQEELFDALLKPAGLAAKQTGNQLLIVPR